MDEKSQRPRTESDSDISLWRILDHTQFMIARSREMELARFALTPEQAYVLDILSAGGGTTTINRLAEITQRQHHSISTLVNRMTRQGLVSKTKSEEDQRQYEVTITEKGRKLFKQVPRTSVKTIFASLPAEQKRELRSHLVVLLRSAYQALGKEFKGQSFEVRARPPRKRSRRRVTRA